jgi:heme-degrading monooxygenase HmoA
LTTPTDWDSLQAHEAYAASDAYKPFLEHLGRASVDVPKAGYHHVDFQPASSLSKAVNAPVTGITTFYCDGVPGANWLSDAAKAAELMGKASADSGFLGLAYGITHEEISHEGVKGKAAVIFVGWQSEQARAAFRETPTFKECLGLLKGEAKAIKVIHVAFKKPAE